MSCFVFSQGNTRGVLWYFGALLVVLSLSSGVSELQANIELKLLGSNGSIEETVSENPDDYGVSIDDDDDENFQCSSPNFLINQSEDKSKLMQINTTVFWRDLNGVGSNLVGVEITLTKEGNPNKITKINTNSSGSALFTDLSNGHYWLEAPAEFKNLMLLEGIENPQYICIDQPGDFGGTFEYTSKPAFSGQVFKCRGTDCNTPARREGAQDVLVVLFKDNTAVDYTTTDSTGNYSFYTSYHPGGYQNLSVAVDASTFTQSHSNDLNSPDYDADDQDLYPEQTWSGMGGICNKNPLYKEGYCYGGINSPNDSDGDNTRDRLRIYNSSECVKLEPSDDSLASCFDLNGAEHVIRISETNSNNLDFGFSYDVVTHTDHKGQGSLINFIGAANNALGTGQMLFVPTVPLNSGGDWWKIIQKDTHPLPEMTGAGILIDGRAMDFSAPDKERFSESTIKSNITVGAQNTILPAFTTKTLELVNSISGTSFLQMNGSNQTVQNIALTSSTDLSVPFIQVLGNCKNCLIKDNLIGISGNGSTADSSAPKAVDSEKKSTLTIDHNLIKKGSTHGLAIQGSATIQGNMINDSADGMDHSDTINIPGNLSGRFITIDRNHISGANDFVIQTGSEGEAVKYLKITNNTINGGARSGKGGGIRLRSAGETKESIQIYGNLITNNKITGVEITRPTARGNWISKNRFENNNYNGTDEMPINLGNNGPNANTGGYVLSEPNKGIDRPIINSVMFDNGELVIEGVAMPDVTLEFYRVQGNDYRYAGLEATENSNQDEDDALGSYRDPVNGTFLEQQKLFKFTNPTNDFKPGDWLAAIAIDNERNTSEFSPLIQVGGAMQSTVTLTPEHNKSTAPGLFVYFPHTLTSSSGGLITLSAQWVNDNSELTNWPIRLKETECKIEEAQSTRGTAETSSLALDLAANKAQCFLASFFIPSETPQGVQRSLEITATAEVDGEVKELANVINQITVTDGGSGRLRLQKWVSTGKEANSTTNTAGSGDTLIYTIQFQNIGAGSLTELKIIDDTPAFTVLPQPVACPHQSSIPAELGECTLTLVGGENASGFRGRIIWNFEGTLQPGAQGEVSYELMVE